MTTRPTNTQSKLTPRQRAVYEFLQKSTSNKGYSPTLREIGKEFGIASLNGVACHLPALEKKGAISREANAARTIQFRDKPLHSTSLELRGEVGAETKLTNSDDVLRVDFMDLLGCGDHFCYRVSDDSLIADSIVAGDYLLCRSQQSYRNGDRVIADVGDAQPQCKRYFRDGDSIRLEPINQSPQSVSTNQANLLGVVLGVIRKLSGQCA